MIKIINDILLKIEENLKSNKEVISLTLVGSIKDKNELEKFNDVDLVLVTKKVDKNILNLLESTYNEIKKAFSSKDLGITYTTRTGAIKVISKKPKTIMLHFIVVSENDYKEKISPILKYFFQKSHPLFGKSLVEVQKIDKLRKEDLLNVHRLGIPSHIRCLESKSVDYYEYKDSEIVSGKQKLKGEKLLDFIFWVTINAGKNIEEYKNNSLSLDLRKFMEEMMKTKSEVRKGINLTPKEIENIRIRAIDYMKKCEVLVKSL